MACRKCDSDIAIPAGDRNSYIEIQRESRTPNASGGFVTAWFPTQQAWVSIEQKNGTERTVNGVLSNVETWKFSGTYADLASILVTDRILFDGVYYNIRGIKDVQLRHITIVIGAEMGVTQ